MTKKYRFYATYKIFSPIQLSNARDAVLKRLISMGKGLEVNTGGLKYGLGFTNPHSDVIKRYRELGGEIVTVGADAHRPEHVGYEFEKAAGILKDCGFQYYTEFKERKPVFKKL